MASPSVEAFTTLMCRSSRGATAIACPEKIAPLPFRLDPLEHGLKLARRSHVTGEKRGRIHRPGHGLDPRVRLVLEIGQRELGTCSAI